MRLFMAIVPVLLLGLVPSVAPAECTTCHSKDPKMVRMHSALGFKDCFKCHGFSAQPFDREKQSSDVRCLTCHKG